MEALEPRLLLTAAPTANLQADDLTAAGGVRLEFNVRYEDDTAINVLTLDGADILVTGPGGRAVSAEFRGVDVYSNGTPRVVTYRIIAPGGIWTTADNGTYTVAVRASQVGDTDGSFVPPGNIGQFAVNIASDVIGQFGNVGGRKAVKLDLTDPDGTRATFALTGAGTGQVIADNGGGWSLVVTGTDARSGVTITTKKGIGWDDGQINLDGIAVGRTNILFDQTNLKSLTASTTNLLGEMTVTGSLGAATLNDVSNAVIAVGTPAEGDTKTATTWLLGRLANVTLGSGTPIASLTATEWLDQADLADQIMAPWIGKLVAKGRKANARAGVAALAGDFQANLVLSGPAAATQPALASATIAGGLSGVDWDIGGKVGTVTVAGNVDGWTLHSTANLLASLASLTVAGATGTTVAVDGPLTALRARQWTGGSISATAINSLTTTADRIGPLDGRFSANVTLAGIVAAVGGTPPKSLGSANIGGAITGGTWDITGPAGTITAKSADATWGVLMRGQAGTIAALTLSNAAATSGGSVTARSIGTVSVLGNLSQAQFVLSQPVDARKKALGSFTVGGSFDDSEVLTRGNIGAITVKTLARSRILASVDISAVPDLLPSLAGQFDSGNADLLATIASVRILGVRTAPGAPAVPSLVNSGIAAGSIGTVNLTGAVADQDDAGGLTAIAFGFATRKPIKSYHGLAAGSVSDYVVRVI